MEVLLVVGGDAAAQERRSLAVWLAEDAEFRGRVREDVPPPDRGTMGAVPELLAVALGPGGAATALAGVVLGWIRRRSGSTTVTLKRADGAEISLAADHVRGLTAEELGGLVERVAASLDGSGDGE
jgi:hypothetical protein